MKDFVCCQQTSDSQDWINLFHRDGRICKFSPIIIYPSQSQNSVLHKKLLWSRQVWCTYNCIVIFELLFLAWGLKIPDLLLWMYGNIIQSACNPHHFDWGFAPLIKIIFWLIIKVCWLHNMPWCSLTISLYQPLHLISPLDGIQCLYRADECNFLLVLWH